MLKRGDFLWALWRTFSSNCTLHTLGCFRPRCDHRMDICMERRQRKKMRVYLAIQHLRSRIQIRPFLLKCIVRWITGEIKQRLKHEHSSGKCAVKVYKRIQVFCCLNCMLQSAHIGRSAIITAACAGRLKSMVQVLNCIVQLVGNSSNRDPDCVVAYVAHTSRQSERSRLRLTLGSQEHYLDAWLHERLDSTCNVAGRPIFVELLVCSDVNTVCFWLYYEVFRDYHVVTRLWVRILLLQSSRCLTLLANIVAGV